ncbi:nuclear pore complex protein NUP98B isoform X2 [Brachypodium distachyon]|uniref:ASCH domain-containing protein n=1 Tax=Brachypodium distachyon TaxID=15368 RepID=A0A0Q3GLC5_BRADI|nr:nuclear pore complex protein NUP98B isoform X2 [Brachypodium distachyon]KQK11960.1 hypothetical protein BRADI_1g00678v3 [Brachypodium distachyon]|eukprot:XP_010229019.1 nuclear pore complex protein NUP98B isoform X2 [Brachypodium distachyon]
MRGGQSRGHGFGGAGAHNNNNGGGGGNGSGRYRSPCLTMHQPWASLLVHGIKRVEGRSWPAPVTGRLWIHAASKVPDPDTVAAMEDFYREIHAVDGVAHIDFPQHYPVSRLLGCVEVVGCVRSQELVCWEDVPESVRLEGLTDFCWLCENPQKLVVPFEMRGYQGVYNLERRIYEGAVRGLSPVQGPLPVKFPLPDPRNQFSLKPGSLTFDSSKSAPVKTPSVSAAIAGARAAATQYSRKDHNAAPSRENETREESRENRRDGSSGSGSLPSIAQNSPSYSQSQKPSSIVQSSHSYSQNQNALSVVQNNPSYSPNQNQSSIVHNSPSYSQNQIPLSNVQDRPSYMHNYSPSFIVLNSPSYLQNQIPASNVQNSPSYLQNHNLLSTVHNSPTYLHSQNPSSNVQTSPSCSQNHNPSFIVQHSPSFLQNNNTSFSVQNSPSFLQNHSPSFIVQNSPSFLQNNYPPFTAQNSPSFWQNQNSEPRRSPRLQGGASNRWH